jgi:prepilin-type N-terminal cleavage/methylation domain-containing protein
MFGKLRDNKGFTMVELMMVMICLGVLIQMAWNFLGDMRMRSADISAVSDGRNLITVVRGSFINMDDIDYKHNPGHGSDIGTKDRSNNPRPAVFTLSPGVRARIIPGSESGTGEQGYYEAYLWHEAGTDDPISPSGKREFWYLADEATQTYSLPMY